MTELVNGVARDLSAVSVAETMTAGVVTCALETTLPEVAKMMVDHRIHCVVACDSDQPSDGSWGVVSDLDLVAAVTAGDIEHLVAGQIAATPLLSVTLNETIERAAQLLSEHAVAHLVVVDPRSGVPVGVLSTLDVMRSVATLGLEVEGAKGETR